MVAMESAAIRSVLRAFIFPNELQNCIAFESWENIAYIMEWLILSAR